MTPPFFSVLIGTVGRPRLVRLSIQSVLKQGFQDFEVVVADCDSTETTSSAVADSNDARVRYFKTPNLDPSLGWDFAFKQSSGRYVLWLDDDNYLLPYALSLFAEIIGSTQAEIVSAKHMYYYGPDHPIPEWRNALGLIPFSLKQSRVDPREVVYALYGYYLATKRMPYRFHPAATCFARDLVCRAVKRTGYAVLPHLPISNSFQPMMFALARSCIHIDRPMAMVGRLGSSITQRARAGEMVAERRPSFHLECSPVSGDTYTNWVTESWLRVKRELSVELKNVELDYRRFFLRYSHELVIVGDDIRKTKALWAELFKAVKNLPSESQKRLKGRILRRYIGWIVSHVLGSVQPGKTIRSVFLWIKGASNYSLGQSRVNRGIVPLDRYGVSNIGDCADRLREIVHKEMGRDILGPLEVEDLHSPFNTLAYKQITKARVDTLKAF